MRQGFAGAGRRGRVFALLQKRHKVPLSPVGGPDAAAACGGKGGRSNPGRGAVFLARAAEAAGGQIALHKRRVAGKEGRGLGFVLLRGEGAGGQQQITARLDKGGGRVQDGRAERGAVANKGRAVLRGGGRLLAEHCPRPSRGRPPARGQTSRAARRPRRGGVLVGDDGVGHAHALEVLAQHAGAGGVVFVGQQQPLPGQRRRQLGRFTARRGAQVGHKQAGAHAEQRGRGGGAGLLHIKSPGVVPGVAAGAQVGVG